MASTTVGISDASTRLFELIDRASRGEEILITRRGELMARLVPPEPTDHVGKGRCLADRIRQSRASHPLGGVSIRAFADEGRR